MEPKKEDLMILHLQQIEARLTELDLAKQRRDNLLNQRDKARTYSNQKNSLIFLFLGAFLGLSFSIKNVLLVLDTILLAIVYLIYIRKSYKLDETKFLRLHKEIEEINKLARGLVEGISHKIIEKGKCLKSS